MSIPKLQLKWPRKVVRRSMTTEDISIQFVYIKENRKFRRYSVSRLHSSSLGNFRYQIPRMAINFRFVNYFGN